MKEPKFEIPNCSACPDMTSLDPYVCEARYCTGFRGKKKKRLPKKGLKRSVAEWCPKRISPPECRIYGFVDEFAELMDYQFNRGPDAVKRNMVYPMEHHYMLRCTYPLEMTAKQFWEEQKMRSSKQLFAGIDIALGEVVEIDDGHRPYFFYYVGISGFAPVFQFDKTRVKPNNS